MSSSAKCADLGVNLRAMIIDGIYGSEMIDSSGEVLDVEGADISDWEAGTMLLDWEHEPGEKGASTIVGKTIFCKKVFSKDDCDNDRQLSYWNKIKVPFIYGVARLFDTAGHEEAKNVAAIIRDCAANKEPIVVRFSVEGHTLERDGQKLKKTVVKRVAVTVKPCNRTAVSGLISDEGAPVGFEKTPDTKVKSTIDKILEKLGIENAEKHETRNGYERLGAASVFEATPEVDEELVKTTTAGGYNGSPSGLTGGAALQVEDRRKKLVAVCKAIARDWSGTGSFKDFARTELSKANMPEVSDDFLDHFEGIVGDVRANLKKADDGAVTPEPTEPKPQAAAPKAPPKAKPLAKPKKPPAEPKEEREAYTILGKPVVPNPDLKPGQVVFDENTGILRTPAGTFQAYSPDKDPTNPKSGGIFHSIWHSDRARRVHDYAFEQWYRLHQELRHGTVKQATVATATMFSMLSPATPVPIHEMMAGYLRDVNNEQGFDSRDPRFGRGYEFDRHTMAATSTNPTFDSWSAKDQPQTFPQHSRPYFEHAIREGITNMHDSPTTGRKTGDRTPFALPESKFHAMSRYHQHHAHFVDIARRHGIDSRSAIVEMMDNKAKDEDWKTASRRKTMPVTGPRPEGASGVYGLSIKTARFAYNMFGGGNTFVPDTHFVRNFWGLDDHADSATIEYMKRAVMWNESLAGNVHQQLDRWYFKNHPSVRYTLERWPDHFKHDPEQAIFPAFWAHWICMADHETALGRPPKFADNLEATHRPMFEEAGEQRQLAHEPPVGARHFNRAKVDDDDTREDLEGDTYRAIKDFGQAVKENPAVGGKKAPKKQKKIRLPGQPWSAQPEFPDDGRPIEDQIFGERPDPLARFKKSESDDPLLHPVHAAYLTYDWVNRLGPVAASMRFFTHIVPLLAPDPYELQPAHPTDRPTVMKFEALAVELSHLVEKLQKAFTAPINTEGRAKKDAEQQQPSTPETPRAKKGLAPIRPAPLLIDAKVHGVSHLNPMPEQQALIHGLDLHGYAKIPSHVRESANTPRWLKHPDGRTVIVKDDGVHRWASRGEVNYANLARDFFGMGHFVPTTAIFRHPVSGQEMSAQEAIPSEHVSLRATKHGLWPATLDNDDHKTWLRKHHVAGDLDKLHLMNMILGNGDRHGANFLMRAEEPHLQLIDNGLSFKFYGRPHIENPTKGKHQAYQPAYVTHLGHHLQEEAGVDPMQQPLHPEALAWLHQLDGTQLMAHMQQLGIPNDARILAAHTLTHFQEQTGGLDPAVGNPAISRYDLINHPELRYR